MKNNILMSRKGYNRTAVIDLDMASRKNGINKGLDKGRKPMRNCPIMIKCTGVTPQTMEMCIMSMR